MTIAELIQNPNALATALTVAFVDEYGTEALSWDPQTIWAELEDLRAKPNRDAVDRLLAGALVLTTDRFQNEVPIFIDVANVMAGGRVSAEVFDPADATECAWAVTEHFLLDPPDDREQSPYSTDVKVYIANVIKYEGLINPPAILISAAGEQYSPTTFDLAYDPEMYASVYKIQKERTEDINKWLHTRLSMLRDQLSHLTLKNGDASRTIQAMTRLLQSP